MGRWGEVDRWVLGLGLFSLTYKYILNKSFWMVKKIIMIRRVMETMSYFLASRPTIQLPSWYHHTLQTHYLKLNSSGHLGGSVT